MITNEDHPLCATLEEIIDRKENPRNTDRVGTVLLSEVFRDIVPKEHLIGKASLPLCCKLHLLQLIRSLFTVGSKAA
jgi:hypothetical protein